MKGFCSWMSETCSQEGPEQPVFSTKLLTLAGRWGSSPCPVLIAPQLPEHGHLHFRTRTPSCCKREINTTDLDLAGGKGQTGGCTLSSGLDLRRSRHSSNNSCSLFPDWRKRIVKTESSRQANQWLGDSGQPGTSGNCSLYKPVEGWGSSYEPGRTQAGES